MALKAVFILFGAKSGIIKKETFVKLSNDTVLLFKAVRSAEIDSDNITGRNT